MRDDEIKDLILVADDRPARRSENSRLLRENGFQVIELSEAGGLPAGLTENVPAVVLNALPGVPEAAAKDQAFRRKTFVLQILDAESSPGPSGEGADAFLKEPYAPAELLAQVNLLRRLRDAERRAAEQQNILRGIVRTSSAIFYIYNPAERRSEFLTPYASEALGYSDEELGRLSDKIIESLMHPDDVPKAYEHFSKLETLRDGEVLEFDYRMRHKSGEWLWFRSRDCVLARAPVAAAGGGITGGSPEKILGVASNITLQKEALYRNLLQEERYQAFIRQSSEGIWRMEFDAEIPAGLPVGEQIDLAVRHAYLAECNDAMAQMYGLENAESLVGSRLTDLFDLSDPANFDFFRSFIESGYRLTGRESHEVDAAGGDKYFLNSLVGVLENDRLVRLWGTQIDITRQKQIEEALRHSERRYRELFDSIDEGFCVCEIILDAAGAPSDYRFLEVNSTFVEQTGLQDPVGKTARQLVPNLEKHWFEIYGRVALTGEPLRFTQGSEAMGRWFDVYAFRPGEPGERKFALLFRNVTERKRTEEALLAAERKAAEEYQRLLSRIVPLAQALGTARELSAIYRQILEFVRASMPCAAFFVSFYDAGTSRRVAAYAWGEQGEIDISDLPPIPLAPDGGPNARAVFTGVTQIVDDYMEKVRPHPHVVVQDTGREPQSALIVPMVVMGRVTGTLEVQAYENGAFHAEHAVALEMAANLAAAAIENVRLLESEALARRSAEAATHAKDEFITLVSHELRSPLNAMLGWARILQNTEIAEADRRQAVETIIRNARAQSKLIEDLLDTARISSGKLRLEIQPVDLRQVVRAAVDVSKPAAEAKEIRIEENLGAGEIGMVEGDPDRLQQIVGNLLSNAVKFTPAGGKIEVGLARKDSAAVITVSDTGVGIDPEFLPRVFEQFTQSDPASTRRHGGLGLGLALARRLAEMHGGGVSAESPGAGAGSTFTVSLPLRSSPPFIDNVTSLRENGMTSEGKLKNLWILIVDDEADARDMVSFMLQINGARVTTARSAVEALDVLQGIGEFEPTPDLIVSDIGMPNEDGYALIQKIRALPAWQGSKIPAIALTAFNRPEDKRSALDAGFQMHLGKPIEPENLIAAICEAAGQKAL